MTFRNKFIQKIYQYIYIRDGQTILIKDIIEETGISRGTVFKYIRWLERRELIERRGKVFNIIPI